MPTVIPSKGRRGPPDSGNDKVPGLVGALWLDMLAARGEGCKTGGAMVWLIPDSEHGPGDVATIAVVTGNRSRMKECVSHRGPPPQHDAGA